MKRTTDKRVGLLRSLFLADPYRKLIAVGFAVGLWFYLDSQVTATDQIDLSLDSVEETREEEWLASLPSPDSLWVKVPPARWTVAGFQNASTGERILGVTLDFSGPKHEIERIREEELRFIATNPGRSDVEELQAQGGFEFTVDDVRVLEFPVPIQRMDPERVKVLLEYNKDAEFQLSTDLIEFELPFHVSAANQQAYRNRILWTDASFAFREVILYGPEAEIPALRNEPKLFRVNLLEMGQGQVGGRLVLLDKFENFSMEPELLNVSLPLELEPKAYTLSVPVFVDDRALPQEDWDRYGPAEPVMEVTVMASGDLDNVLTSQISPAAQREWARQHMRLFVYLQPGFDPSVVKVQEARLLIPSEDIDSRYYRLEHAVTVTIVDKTKGN